jgi:hypothetical protein
VVVVVVAVWAKDGLTVPAGFFVLAHARPAAVPLVVPGRLLRAIPPQLHERVTRQAETHGKPRRDGHPSVAAIWGADLHFRGGLWFVINRECFLAGRLSASISETGAPGPRRNCSRRIGRGAWALALRPPPRARWLAGQLRRPNWPAVDEVRREDEVLGGGPEAEHSIQLAWTRAGARGRLCAAHGQLLASQDVSTGATGGDPRGTPSI